MHNQRPGAGGEDREAPVRRTSSRPGQSGRAIAGAWRGPRMNLVDQTWNTAPAAQLLMLVRAHRLLNAAGRYRS